MDISRILVGYGENAESDDALALARELAAAGDAQIVLGRVLPWEVPAPPIPTTVAIRHAAEQRVSEEREAFERFAVATGTEPQLIKSGSPAHGLHDLAQTLNVDLVVVGSSHRAGFREVLAGTVGVSLLNGLDRGVAVAPRGYRQAAPHTLERIGVGFDGSAESRAALHVAAGIASARQGRLSVVAVAQVQPSGSTSPWGFGWSSPEVIATAHDRTQQLVDEALEDLPDGPAADGRVVNGMAAPILVELAEDMDLLVMGSRGYGPVRRVLLGSVSAYVVRFAPCPVVVIPRGEAGPPESEHAALASAVRVD